MTCFKTFLSNIFGKKKSLIQVSKNYTYSMLPVYYYIYLCIICLSVLLSILES